MRKRKATGEHPRGFVHNNTRIWLVNIGIVYDLCVTFVVARRDELDKDMTGIKITFTLDGDENNDSVSRVSGGSEGEYQA